RHPPAAARDLRRCRPVRRRGPLGWTDRPDRRLRRSRRRPRLRLSIRKDQRLSRYTDLQLDALRELANIGSGTASTALSSMLGRSVDISVPNASVLPLADAVDATGPAESEITGIVLGVIGELTGTVLLLVPPEDAAT